MSQDGITVLQPGPNRVRPYVKKNNKNQITMINIMKNTEKKMKNFTRELKSVPKGQIEIPDLNKYYNKLITNLCLIAK